MSELSKYAGIPWKSGGRDRAGVDCVGLTQLFLRDHGVDLTVPAIAADSQVVSKAELQAILAGLKMPATLKARDVVFFRHRERRSEWHVGVHVGNGRLLHIAQGAESRVDESFELLRRSGLDAVGALGAEDVQTLCKALSAQGMGYQVALTLVIGLILTGISMALTPKPKFPRLRSNAGRYGNDALITQQSTEIPLPEIFGPIAVAGNMVHQSVADKSLTVTDLTVQRQNKVVIIGTGPIKDIDDIQINGVSFSSKTWFAGTATGYKVDPAQTKAEAVTGTIGGETNRSSVTLYEGQYDIDVPVDIRASYEREFPVYGFNGCSYLVFRAIDSTKYNQGFNVLIQLRGRFCREFDGSGFIVPDWVGEEITADGTAVRFKMAFEDIKEISTVQVITGGFPVTHTLMSPTNQTGNVYWLNKTKGYLELLTAPAAGAKVAVTYKYYKRSYTINPARHGVYLLTEPVQGKGYSEDKIDWAKMNSHQTHCDEVITWANADGVSSVSRYFAAYTVDARKPIEEHLRALLDACNSVMFISGGKIAFKARKAESSVFSFDASNILEGSFKSWELPPGERPNRVNFSYYSLENFSALDGVPRNDDPDQDRRGKTVPVTIEYLAVAAKQQAERMAEMALRESVNRRWMCEFTTTIKALAIEPLDVVGVTHPSRPSWAGKLFRVEWIEADEQDRYKLTLSEYFAGAYI